MGSSDSDSSSDSGRSNRSSHKKEKSHKKDKKEKKDKKGSGDEKKDKKDKDKKKDDKGKDKKDKKDDKHKTESKPSSQLPAQIAHALSGTALGGLAQEFLQGGSGHGGGLLREGPAPGPGGVLGGGPPSIPANPIAEPNPGASGRRIPISTTDPFPAQAAGPAPPFVDPTGQPVYVGSALVDGSNVQPCRITPSGVFIAANGIEAPHNGRYDLLPLTDAMQWHPASGGQPPAGKRLVEGGIENGSPLHHACARVNSVITPGKAGPALGGAQIPANGASNFFAQDYYVLVWKE